MEILVFFVVIVLLTVFPVMVAAKILGAEKKLIFLMFTGRYSLFRSEQSRYSSSRQSTTG